MPENLYFESVESLAAFFRDGRTYFNELYVKKMAQLSIYWNRVPVMSWPLNSTTEQTGFRFGRGWYNVDAPWFPINTTCGGDSCDSEFEVVKMPGTDSYVWDLLRRDMVTDWFCVETLLYKLFPADQVMQIEETNMIISKHVHEEATRANYIGAAGHHWLPISNDGQTYCGLASDQGWYVAQNTSIAGAQGFTLQYVYVNLPVNQLGNIAFLGLDLLDDILIILQNEDDAYRLDLSEAAGAPLLDIIVPDARTARKLYFQAKESNGYWGSNSGFTPDISALQLGIRRIIGDYAFSYDIDASRFNTDDAYNATVVYNSSNPASWPRLIRVPRYVLVAAGQGGKWVPNQDYQNADFSISMPWIETGVVKWMMPSATGYGNVQMPAQDYAGAWEFFNPKETANPFQKMGRFQAQHRIGFQIPDPTLLHPILHRLDRTRSFTGSPCPLNTYYAPSANPNVFNCVGTGAFL